MGWLRGASKTLKSGSFTSQQTSNPQASSFKEEESHIEDIAVAGRTKSLLQDGKFPSQGQWPFQDSRVADEDLPFITLEDVSAKRRPGAIDSTSNKIEEGGNYWIVVDDVVYDCTSFILDHPGGRQVILSFVGEDCSWQFWRFHGKSEMEQYGRCLRIGRTKGVLNRFKEPVRFVGLSKLGDNDWD